MGRKVACFLVFVAYIYFKEIYCYEKTLRKIVRNQSKMIQTPFSDSLRAKNKHSSELKDYLLFSGSHSKTPVNDGHKLKTHTASSLEISHNIHSKPTYSLLKIPKTGHQKDSVSEQRLTRNTFNTSDTQLQNSYHILLPEDTSDLTQRNLSQSGEIILEEINNIPPVPYFPAINKINVDSSSNPTLLHFDAKSEVSEKKIDFEKSGINNNQTILEIQNDYETSLMSMGNAIGELPSEDLLNSSAVFKTCDNLEYYKATVDVQEKLLEVDISPSWLEKGHFWNKIYNNRYEYLMRNPDWPPLKVILVPRTQVSSIWKKPFESFHNETVRKIITNVVKKLQFYPNLTFTWNEVSHLSTWWKTASQKRRLSLRRLIKEGRFEITTGGWVETDEATSNLFGILHQFIEGHQWLEQNLNYHPNVAWLTNSVTHSSTFPYILSSLGIFQLIFTNIHFSLEEYFSEYQYSDFVWVQNWVIEKSMQTDVNKILKKIGKDQYPKHSVLTHYLPFNSDSFKSCGPQSSICNEEYNFANKVNDVNSYNVKDKSETLLEQYSKTGTLSPHNIILAPLGGPQYYEKQTEFDYQYNNYKSIADFVNINQDIYKATIEFGTANDYFQSIVERHHSYPTLKGNFMTFAEVIKKRSAYWTGFFTSRPTLKILLRRLQAALRSAEMLFTFASSLNVVGGFNTTSIMKKLISAREIVARLQDRNVVSGTLPATMLKYVYNQILFAAKNCWYVQEITASLLSSKPHIHDKYLTKYVYRDGEFISSFKSIEAGDQLYIFNSLSHERTEIIELLTRNLNIRVIDHNNKEITFQINPVWKYSAIENLIRINEQFYKIIFVVNVAPMTLKLFKFGETFTSSLSMATVYCIICVSVHSKNPFNVQPLEPGDIQIENYNIRLIFDEYTGMLKTVVEKDTNTERQILVEYGAFKSSDVNSGMFLFNTNASSPIYDILKQFKTVDKKEKSVLIVSGNVVTDFTSLYGNLLHQTVRINNFLNNPLSGVIRIESKVDFEVSPKNRDLEMFITIQTDILNGNPPEIYLDTNGFHTTLHKLNISRSVEANMNPLTNMAFIQGEKDRLTVITDHTRGVSALQEGQILLMLDRRVLFNDGRGVDEGLADSGATSHVHYLLLENILKHDEISDKVILPSLLAHQMVNILNYPLDIFYIDKRFSDYCFYGFLPLVKASLPCDVTIINFRTLLGRRFTRNFVPNSAILTLHRQSFTCEITPTVHFQCNTNAKFNIETIIQNIKAVYHTNLVGTNKGTLITNSISKTDFPPMELMTLKIYFGI